MIRRKAHFEYLSLGGRKKVARGYVYKGIIFERHADAVKYAKRLAEQEEKYQTSSKGKAVRFAAAGIETALALGGVAAGQPASALLLIPAASVAIPDKYQRAAKKKLKELKELV